MTDPNAQQQEEVDSKRLVEIINEINMAQVNTYSMH